MKIFAAGVGAAATGLATLGVAAVNAYGDFQQLEGGIETLFGARGAESVEEYAELVGKSVDEVRDEFDMLMEAQSLAMENANNAYKTAGLSANDYMETVTGLAASLKQSTETEVEAAEAADQAIIDMADNANKMGTSMDAIQNAYQGFAKQNYTMLDNLKLGYGGTKTEMERLLADATALTGIEYDIDNLADVYEAIHVIQTELGITGATAAEASTTIQGSVTAMGAAWSNLVVGIADENANLEELIENFVDSVEIVVINMLPIVEQVLSGIGTLIETLLPIIVARIPEIVNTVLPNLLVSGTNMLLTIINGIVAALPELANTAYQLIAQLVTCITNNAGTVIGSGSETLLQFITGIANAIPDLMMMATDLIISLAMALTEPGVIENIISAGIELIVKLIEGLTEALPRLFEAAPTIISRLIAGIVKSLPKLASAAVSIVGKLADFIVGCLSDLFSLGDDFLSALDDSFSDTDWADLGESIIDGIWAGIEDGWDWLVDCVEDLANDLFGAACDELDINSPSKKFRWIGEMCVEGVDEPLEEYNPYETFQNSMEANIGGLKDTYASATSRLGGGGPVNYSQTVNVYQPVSTPDELARTMRTESKFGLMTGEVIPVG